MYSFVGLEKSVVQLTTWIGFTVSVSIEYDASIPFVSAAKEIVWFSAEAVNVKVKCCQDVEVWDLLIVPIVFEPTLTAKEVLLVLLPYCGSNWIRSKSTW